MWWNELDLLESKIQYLNKLHQSIINKIYNKNEKIKKNIVIDETYGPVFIGIGTVISENVIIKGPVFIGENSLIGNSVLIRGNTYIGNNVRLGFSTEVKNSIIEDNVSVGPQSFVADSKIEKNTYLAAQVRTSNHRLDKKNIHVFVNGSLVDTQKQKLGCLIGKGSTLGVQVVILPGRIIAENTVIGPKVLVEKNLASGKYFLKQEIIKNI